MKPRNAWWIPLVLCASAAVAQETTAPEKVSSFSHYAGYSTPRYDGWTRESFYVPMQDGVRLAVDLFRPTRDGALHTEPLPLVWTHDRYHRSDVRGGQVMSKVEGMPGLRSLLRHGYLIADVDVRGAGASFGTWTGIFNEAETRDAYELTEWFAAQEWCDGNIGMWGGSYLGGTQFMAASRCPPHLKAIFPWVALVDQYDVIWGGGIRRDDMCRFWGTLTRLLDETATVTPVDGPDGARLRQEAMAEHRGNLHFEEHVAAMPFRDSAPTDGFTSYAAGSPMDQLDAIRRSGVAIYHQAGWFDVFVRDAVVAYRTLDNPQKVVIGPWFHTQSGGVDWDAEVLRWFDRWLKGVDNGVMDEPPIHYYLMGAPPETAWRSADTWPLPDERREPFFLAAGPSGSVDSVNDGLLVRGAAPDQDDVDDYMVDPTTSVGPLNRWTAAVGQAGNDPRYRPQEENDAKCLTWTTAPLAADVVVTGHPVAHLWIEATEQDADVFLYLEEVLPDGTSRYVTEGCLRGSHRALAAAPYECFGLPFHRHFAADVAPLPEEPVELVFDLQPTANLFDRGHRIRVTLAGADFETCDTPVTDPPTELFLYRSAEYPSRVVLPVIPGAAGG